MLLVLIHFHKKITSLSMIASEILAGEALAGEALTGVRFAIPPILTGLVALALGVVDSLAMSIIANLKVD